MHFPLLTSTLFASFLFSTCTSAQYPKSPKRGLVSVTTNNPPDESLFVKPNNGLTWYYNYGMTPTPSYLSIPQSTLEFVPMLWGASNLTGTSFLANVTALIKSGRNITHVLGFNEPDVNYTASGSQISPELAAKTWMGNLEPLRKMGVKVGMPVVFADEGGFEWLERFHEACGRRNGSCEADFASLHVFGNGSFVRGYVGEYKKRYPALPLWITEFALPYSSVQATEQFFNDTLALFDNDTMIERYAYFGAFRASASGVGWNASFLDGTGKLTDIGSWYLGGGEVGTGSSKTSAGMPAQTSSTKKSGAGRVVRRLGDGLGGLMVGVGVVGGMMLLC